MEPETLNIKINERESVTALLYPAPKRVRLGVTIVLGHGAGANQLSGFMREFALGLAARGIDSMTFNFLYTEQKRKLPDAKERLESCYRAVIDAALKHAKLKKNRLVIGGKSMGGRIASQVAAADGKNIAGLVLLGYPLHPPGRPDKMRDQHLKEIQAPMRFVQGSRDAFGTADEMRHHKETSLARNALCDRRRRSFFQSAEERGCAAAGSLRSSNGRGSCMVAIVSEPGAVATVSEPRAVATGSSSFAELLDPIATAPGCDRVLTHSR